MTTCYTLLVIFIFRIMHNTLLLSDLTKSKQLEILVLVMENKLIRIVNTIVHIKIK